MVTTAVTPTHSSSDANAEIAELYAGNAGLIRRLVEGGVDAPAALIEDACEVAWSRLLGWWDRVGGDDAAVAWLVTTAIREACRENRRERRHVSIADLLDDDNDLAQLGVTATLETVAERRARVDSLRTLPERQQRLLWLKALGLSRSEIADRAGTTTRTVERELCRARRRLAAEAAA